MISMRQRVFVNLGEVYFGQGDLQVETLLGSCVAIVLWHPVRRLGGLCHFVLPARKLQREPRPEEVPWEPDGRYGEEALVRLTNEVRRHDSLISDYTVKVFGGGNVLGLPPSKARIGQANVDCALAMLHRQNIPITSQDIAGEGYRYLRFDLGTGDVWVRRGHGIVHQMEKLAVADKSDAVLAQSDSVLAGRSCR